MYEGLKNLEVPKRPRGKHPGARRVFKIGGFGLLVLLVAVAGTGVWLYNHVNDKLDQARDESIITDALLPGEGFNVLVLGNDQRNVLPKKERKLRHFKGSGGRLTDTILVVHVSPKAEKAVVLSFPRDLRVDIPGCGLGKINSAFSCTGKVDINRTTQTIKRFSGLDINYVVSINYVGFRAMVDAIGGVDICVKRAYDDPKSGLKIPKPGCYDMDGDMALAWVRARSIDPRADLGRVERQQQFIRSLMGKIKSVGFLLNLPRVAKLADALPKGVTISKNVDFGVARAVAAKLSGNQRAVDFRTVPATSRYIGNVSYLIPDEPDADRLFRAIENDTALPDVGKTAASLPSPKDVRIRILNGTGVPGLAGKEGERLEKLGFDVVSIGDAPSRYQRTVLTFEQGRELAVELVDQQYEDIETDVRAVQRDLPVDVVITLGADLAALRASPSPST